MDISITEPKWRPIHNGAAQRAGSEHSPIYLTKFLDFRSGAEIYEVIEVCKDDCIWHKGGLSRGHVLARGCPGTAGLKEILPKLLSMSPKCEGVSEVLGNVLYLIGATSKGCLCQDWLK